MRAHGMLPAFALALAGCAATPPATPPGLPGPGVDGVEARHLDPAFWLARAPAADRVTLDADAVAAQNARLERVDPTLHDLERLPAQIPRETVRGWVAGMSRRPEEPMYDERGREYTVADLDALAAATALDAIPDRQSARYGLVVRRANLRRFPSPARAFEDQGDIDIDRFQESAAFPGTPVAIVHESRDGGWWFVVTPNYTAWIEKSAVAEGGREGVFGYVRRAPYLVVTGARAFTVHTEDRPEVSELQLDMGVRLPLAADWPAGKPVNGQLAHAGWVVELPVRGPDGALGFVPALVPRTADVHAGYLTLTRAALIGQAFKFLGERYGWGHANNARDCSGFVGEVYRSFGVELPRNSRDQGESPGFDRIAFTDADPHAARVPALRALEVGDLVYIPGHVMMVIGRDRGRLYVIHDTAGVTWRDAAGMLRRAPLNGVSVTPLEPLLLGDGRPYVDGMYSIQRIRPREAK
jgi:hypothetical protein